MNEAKRIANAFRKIHSAAVVIDKILNDNHELEMGRPDNWPIRHDKFAAECEAMVRHYDKLAGREL